MAKPTPIQSASLEQNPAAVAEPQAHRARGAELLALGILLSVLTAWVYLPTLRGEFIHLDDPAYVTANSAVLQGLHGQNVLWAFTATDASNWHPLTWISHMLDVQLFGLRAGGHHLVNVAFHLANTLLLFLVLLRLTGALWRCFFVAALFALHPLHVESVAWISERKDVLSTFFGLLALGAYVRYATRATRRARSGFYLLSLFLFAGSLMSKPTLVTFPFLLLLLDYWPLGRLSPSPLAPRLSPLFLEKLPFLALSAASSVITVLAQARGGAVRTVDSLPLGGRVANAVLGYIAYLQKAFWPADLAVMYPLPPQRPEWQVIGAALLLAALTLGALLAWRRRYLLVGWLWFLGTLVPMIGLVQVGDQAIADRYMYLPLIGLAVALTWGLCELWPQHGAWRGRVLGAGMLLVAGSCAALTSRQVALWQNTETLMRHALAVTQRNYVAYDNLGNYYLDHERIPEAMECYRKSLSIHYRLEPLNNLGLTLAKQGQHTNAIATFEMALRQFPNEIGVRLNLADSLSAIGRTEDTIAQYEAILRLRPKEAAVRHELALLLAEHRRFDQAIEHYQTTLRHAPDFPGARNNLAFALTQTGRLDDAIAQYQLVLRDHPDDLQTHNNLGIALTTQGKLDAAIAQFQHALKLDTNYANAYVNLGNALAAQNKFPEALQAFRQFVRLKPDDPRGHQGLGRGLFEQGKLDQALPELRFAANAQKDNPEPHHFYGLALARKGRLEEAVLELTIAQRLQPSHPEIRYHLGLALQQSGKTNDALLQFQEALRLEPAYAEVHRHLASLAPATNSTLTAPGGHPR